MPVLKPTRPPNPTRPIVLTFKVSAQEMQALLARAHGFTKGNLSEWIRFAALKLKPRKEDFEK